MERQMEFLLLAWLAVFGGLYAGGLRLVEKRATGGHEIGPTAYPTLLLILFAVLLVALLCRAGATAPRQTPDDANQPSLCWAYRREAMVVLLLVLYAAMVPVLGIVCTTPLFLAAHACFYGRPRLPVVVGTALGGSLFVYLLLGQVFESSLPW